MSVFGWLAQYWHDCHPHECRFVEVRATPTFESSVLTGVPVQVGWERRWECKCGRFREESERGTGASAQQDLWTEYLKSGHKMICMGYLVGWDHTTNKPTYEKLEEE